MFSIAVGFTLV